jgi:hypothetical protein
VRFYLALNGCVFVGTERRSAEDCQTPRELNGRFGIGRVGDSQSRLGNGVKFHSRCWFPFASATAREAEPGVQADAEHKKDRGGADQKTVSAVGPQSATDALQHSLP